MATSKSTPIKAKNEKTAAPAPVAKAPAPAAKAPAPTPAKAATPIKPAAPAKGAAKPASNYIPTEAEIKTRAYEIYVSEGCQDGHDTEYWLRAETELRGQAGR